MKDENGWSALLRELRVPSKLYQLHGKEEQMEVDPPKPQQGDH